MINNPQEKFWKGKFGIEYTDRNTYSIEELDEFYLKTWGITRNSMNIEFLRNIDKKSKILEVGCNNGQQLRHLHLMGFKKLYGIEIQYDAVEKAKLSTKNINIIQDSAFDMPFKQEYFDLIFTSGLLIHISPTHLITAIKEIYRCTKKYIWGFEYYSDEPKEITYRGNAGFLWKRNFADLYLQNFNTLKLIKEKRYKYVNNENTDQMFLIEKI